MRDLFGGAGLACWIFALVRAPWEGWWQAAIAGSVMIAVAAVIEMASKRSTGNRPPEI